MTTELVKKALEFEVRQVDDAKRILEFVASTSHVDRYGDIIEPDGWDTKDFFRSGPGPFAWGHNYSAPNPGKILKAWVEGKQFKIRVQFASPEEYGIGWPAIYPTPDTVYRLYKSGYLKSVSVGFMPLEREPITDPKQDGRQTGWRFLKSSLYEVSAVVVPANPHANISKAFQEAREHEVVSEQELALLQALAKQEEDAPSPLEQRLLDLEMPLPGEGEDPSWWHLEQLFMHIDGLEARIAELEATALVPAEMNLAIDPDQLKDAVTAALETLAAKGQVCGRLTDFYSLAMDPGYQPEGVPPQGETAALDLSQTINRFKTIVPAKQG